jgi:hypothetical protein
MLKIFFEKYVVHVENMPFLKIKENGNLACKCFIAYNHVFYTQGIIGAKL